MQHQPDCERPSTLHPPPSTRKLSLVATVLNERAHLREWLELIAGQSRLPDEVVICDGGSTDGTCEELRAWAAERSTPKFPLRVICKPGANIANGRNAAIAAACGEIIAVTDAGCRPRADWLEQLVQPFERSAAVQAVAGSYRFLVRTRFQQAAAAYLGQPWRQAGFLPSSRSVAFTRAAWQAAGGYPEWLTHAAEDTLFNYSLLASGSQFVAAPGAIVDWELRPNAGAFIRMIARNAFGDTETGLAGAAALHGHMQLALPLLALIVCLGALGPIAGFGVVVGCAAVLLGFALVGKALYRRAPLACWPQFFLLCLAGGPAYLWGYWRCRHAQGFMQAQGRRK